ncbi:hypothetical protein GCM10027068_19320 [Prescottella soli]
MSSNPRAANRSIPTAAMRSRVVVGLLPIRDDGFLRVRTGVTSFTSHCAPDAITVVNRVTVKQSLWAPTPVPGSDVEEE